MLAHRLRRWTDNKTTLGQSLVYDVFVGPSWYTLLLLYADWFYKLGCIVISFIGPIGSKGRKCKVAFCPLYLLIFIAGYQHCWILTLRCLPGCIIVCQQFVSLKRINRLWLYCTQCLPTCLSGLMNFNKILKYLKNFPNPWQLFTLICYPKWLDL